MIRGIYICGRMIFNELPAVGSNVVVEQWGYAAVRKIRAGKGSDHEIELEWFKDGIDSDFDYANEYLLSIKQGFAN